MRLGNFIAAHMEPILKEWDAFAATLQPAAGRLDSSELRDHAKAMLDAIVLDLAQYQSAEEQKLKSQGLAPEAPGELPTAAQTHATLRARDGFDINQMAAEYRALRAAVLRLWLASAAPGPADLQDLIRFNEAIDQALAESVADFSVAVEHGRNLLLGMLGHDIRNPLSVIVMTANYLTRLEAGPEVSVAVKRLVRSAARVEALVNDLVDFSRAKLGVGLNLLPLPVDLEAIFRDELDLQHAAHPGRTVTLDVTGDVLGDWDANRIHQILGNLVSNALKYGSPDAPVSVKLAGEAKQVRFSVDNQGPPIPATFIRDMFNPLTRGVQAASSAGPLDSSLGLGLYIAQEIVHAHKGAITVRSDESGTMFTVELPR